MMHRVTDWVLAAIIAGLVARGAAGLDELRHDEWVVVTPTEAPAVLAKAAAMLCDEIHRRTQLHVRSQPTLPSEDVAGIALGVVGMMPPGTPDPPAGLAVPHAAEGYAVWVDTTSRKAPVVCIVGRDARGALFGAGRLLRALRMTKGVARAGRQGIATPCLGIREGQMSVDANLKVSSAPRYPVRGHELGYRNKSNTYDAWSVEQYEQYIRDLAVFGANTVQLLAELNHMDVEGPHMTEPVLERMTKLTRLIGSYDLRVWIWLPPGENAFRPETREQTLAVCRTLFEQCSPIHAVFVPGGDPGDAHPRLLLPWLEEMAGIVRESHPEAEVWLSNEDMPHDWNDYLLDFLNQERPTWLTAWCLGHG